MPETPCHVVTGAFGFTGRRIAARLLEQGHRVRTLTGSPGPDPFNGAVPVHSLDFRRPEALAEAMRGAATLFNTYWIRFPRGGASHLTAVENTRVLLEAAASAGVRRVVHISITGASADSRLTYFRGKAVAEEAVRVSGLGYAILRPSLVFGEGDVLLNNIAWFLRRFPLFPVPGSGKYLVQPVAVDDVAELAVASAFEDRDVEMDAIGPETLSFLDLVRQVKEAVGSRAAVMGAPPSLALAASGLMGALIRDVVLTRQEVEGLMAGLLVGSGPSTARTRVSQWLREHGAGLGRRYASELSRHYQRRSAAPDRRRGS